MATLSYSDQATPYSQTRPTARAGTYLEHSDVGSTAFLWIAWALAAAFWAATMTTFLGIMSAIMHPTYAGPAGGADAGGIGFAMMDVIGGVVVLGLALAYGLYRYSTRDKGLDPVTEAATHALYDGIERQGGEDMTTRSPEAREPQERDAYRSINRDQV